MSKYGDTAILAVQLLNDEEVADPSEAWKIAAKKIFPASKDLQDKGCPRGAFLGLCSKGLINGVESGDYGKRSKNGDYAIRAVETLKKIVLLLLSQTFFGRRLRVNQKLRITKWMLLWLCGGGN